MPFWLAGAAILAYLPGWRPGAIAILVGSVLPFLPIAVIARLSAQNEAFLSERPYLAAAGLPAIFAAGIALALALAAFVIRVSRSLTRPRPPAPSRSSSPSPIMGLLPAPPTELPLSRTFDFRVPELPPVPPLHALDDEFPIAEIPELPPVFEDVDVAEEAEASEETDVPGKTAVAEQTVLELEGERHIAFTSVPPSHAQVEEASAVSAAALKRVLARNKPKPWFVPSDGVLTAYPDGEYWIIDEKTKRSAEVLRETLAEFKIEAEVTGIRKGPVITPQGSSFPRSPISGTTSRSSSRPQACASSHPFPASTRWASRCPTRGAPSSRCAR